MTTFRFLSNLKLLKGGEIMKKAIALTLLALFVITTGAWAIPESVTIPIYGPGGGGRVTGFNCIAPPLVPGIKIDGTVYDATPANVFKDSSGVALVINNLLKRFDAPTQGYKIYTTMNPTAYGKVLLGDGAWLKRTAAGDTNWTYQGVPNGIPDAAGAMTDIWISLPKAGISVGTYAFTLIGHPFSAAAPAINGGKVRYSYCSMTDGTSTKTIQQAVTAGWTDGTAIGYNAVTQGNKLVGSTAMAPNKYLEPGMGYWIKTKYPNNNLALIIPANFAL